jgi:hypothetical protein
MLNHTTHVLIEGFKDDELKATLNDMINCAVASIAKKLSDQQLSRIATSGIFPQEPYSPRGLKIMKLRELTATLLRENPIFRSTDPELVVLKIEAAMQLGNQ